jgi:hypothetical protein
LNWLTGIPGNAEPQPELFSQGAQLSSLPKAQAKTYPVFDIEDSVDLVQSDSFQSEHVVNFLVRQKEEDLECIYIDCVLKNKAQERLTELESLGYNRGPVRSKDIVIHDKSLVRVSTTGAISLSMDGTDCSGFEILFDSELDSAGEEGWVMPKASMCDTDVFRYKGFVTFSVAQSTLCARERHRSFGDMSDSVDVVLCALPLAIKVGTYEEK